MLQPLDFRIPKWIDEELIDRKCPICESANFSPLFLRPDGLRVCQCHDCSTNYINPCPKPEQLFLFYDDYYKNHADTSATSIEKFSFETKILDPLSDFRIRTLMNYVDHLMPLKSAMDIGCGRGQFLYLLKKIGFDVQGIEPDRSALAFANRIGIEKLFSGYIENFKSKDKFKLITMLDLIEHPIYPIPLIKEALNHLDTNGLLIIWTPNGNLNYSQLENITYRVDLDHMQYLSKDSCKHIANIFQLDILHLETLGSHEYFHSSERISDPNLHNSNKKLKSILKNILTSIPGWYVFIAPLIYKYRANKIETESENLNYHLFCIFKKTI